MGNRAITAAPARHIFVIDDDPAILASLKFSLELEGYSVRTYPSARAAIADPTRPEPGCVVIDYNLKDGDAFAALDQLRTRDGPIRPAIIITSHPSQQLRRRAADAGIAIVEKPLFGNSLVEALRRVVPS